MKLIFEAAGWIMASRAETSPALSYAATQSLPEEAYVRRPLRSMYLFGRPQDYGFAHLELVTVVQARHYVRIWRSSFAVNRQPLWVGAAAHDTGAWWDSRTGAVSYKVDPNVDSEREFVRDTLNATGLVQRFGYLAFSAGGQVPTATGSSLETDGRVLVMTLVKF